MPLSILKHHWFVRSSSAVTVEWSDKKPDGWMDAWMDAWMDGCMDGWIYKQRYFTTVVLSKLQSILIFTKAVQIITIKIINFECNEFTKDNYNYRNTT